MYQFLQCLLRSALYLIATTFVKHETGYPSIVMTPPTSKNQFSKRHVPISLNAASNSRRNHVPAFLGQGPYIATYPRLHSQSEPQVAH
jgi:hypothetical protein